MKQRQENESQENQPQEPTQGLAETNAILAEWAARSAVESAPLIARLERMGYAVRGKSEEEISEVLKHPPTQPAAA
ncbi:hypothetical protein [Methylobacterium soli]|uniref:Uncharacterized protein n=1 Tax=Methylobacterium soli TaxID=553447 RepID=A0A6L3SU17_9HYPH|nr:hypothetical protein [Methylobacterium soli]KAB1076948.1 hypothetical protein F6X53_21085 [Methylobacterium soli]GJE42718.1 hypothetical protein AEGHOMDF_1891 [Methylobacterium soli]